MDQVFNHVFHRLKTISFDFFILLSFWRRFLNTLFNPWEVHSFEVKFFQLRLLRILSNFHSAQLPKHPFVFTKAFRKVSLPPLSSISVCLCGIWEGPAYMESTIVWPFDFLVWADEILKSRILWVLNGAYLRWVRNLPSSIHVGEHTWEWWLWNC